MFVTLCQRSVQSVERAGCSRPWNCYSFGLFSCIIEDVCWPWNHHTTTKGHLFTRAIRWLSLCHCIFHFQSSAHLLHVIHKPLCYICLLSNCCSEALRAPRQRRLDLLGMQLSLVFIMNIVLWAAFHQLCYWQCGITLWNSKKIEIWGMSSFIQRGFCAVGANAGLNLCW